MEPIFFFSDQLSVNKHKTLLEIAERNFDLAYSHYQMVSHFYLSEGYCVITVRKQNKRIEGEKKERRRGTNIV